MFFTLFPILTREDGNMNFDEGRNKYVTDLRQQISDQLIYHVRATCLTHLNSSWFYHRNNDCWRLQIMKLLM